MEKELGGFFDPVDNVFPRQMPYCDVDLTPHWDYDIEKAILLSCNLLDEGSVAQPHLNKDNSFALSIGLGIGAVALVAVGAAVLFMCKVKELEAKYVVPEAAIAA